MSVWQHHCQQAGRLLMLPLGAKCPDCAVNHGVPKKIRGPLAMLRESFAHRVTVEDEQAERWGRLAIEERRLLLAFAGLDDSEEAARRPLRQMLPEQRLELMTELRRVRRLVGRLQWA